MNISFWIDAVEAKGDNLARGPMELRRQLGSSRARADDGDVELSRTHRTGLRICANARVDEPVVETHRLLGRLEGDGMLAHPRRTEIIRNAADPNDQRVIV